MTNRWVRGLLGLALTGAVLSACQQDVTSPGEDPSAGPASGALSQVGPSAARATPGSGGPALVPRRSLEGAAHSLYADRVAFLSTFPGLTMEDFETGGPAPGTIPGCGSPFSATNLGCGYGVGDIVPGFSLESSTFRPTNGIFGLPPGLGFGNSSKVIGINFFVDIGFLHFDEGVCAVGLDVGSFLSGGGTMTVGIFDGQNAFVDAVEVSKAGSFLGIFNPGGISRLDLVDGSGGAEFIDNLAFGCPDTCVVNLIELRSALADLSLPGIWLSLLEPHLQRLENGDQNAIQSLRGILFFLRRYGVISGGEANLLSSIINACQ